MPSRQSMPAFNPMTLPSAIECDVLVRGAEPLDALVSCHSLDAGRSGVLVPHFSTKAMRPMTGRTCVDTLRE